MDKDCFISMVRARQKEMCGHIPVLRDLPADDGGRFALCEVITFIGILGAWIDQFDCDALGPKTQADVDRQYAENRERWQRDDPGKLRILDELTNPTPRPSAVPADTVYEPYNQVWFQGSTGQSFNADGSVGLLKPWPWFKPTPVELRAAAKPEAPVASVANGAAKH